MLTSALVAPGMVEEAVVRVPERSASGLRAWPGVSEMLLGRKVDSEGAVPGAWVSAWNSGLASLPTWTAGSCCFSC